MTSPQPLELRFANQLPQLLQAMDRVDAFLKSLQAGDVALHTARLALEEMGTNILKYGYDDKLPHEIVVRIHVLPELFVLELIDDGHAFNPCCRPEPDPNLPLEQRKPGGWGISLVRQLAERVEYERCEPCNHLRISIPRFR